MRGAQAFWSHVDTSSGAAGCWPWTGYAYWNGYGQAWYAGKVRKAHRVAYELTFGPIPQHPGYHGLVVMHSCDNRLCCNPAHLKLGTHRENMADKVHKRRQARGTSHGKARLTEESVRAIRERCAAGETQESVARAFGVSRGAVCHILAGRSWGWCA